MEAAPPSSSDRGIRELLPDPTFSFVALVESVAAFQSLGRPMVVGPSRKSFIGHGLDAPSSDRLEGTIAACVLAHARGARIFRVHDVAPVRRAPLVADATVRSTLGRDLR